MKDQEKRKTSIDYYASNIGGLQRNFRPKPDNYLHTGSFSDRQAEYESGQMTIYDEKLEDLTKKNSLKITESHSRLPTRSYAANVISKFESLVTNKGKQSAQGMARVHRRTISSIVGDTLRN